MSFLQSNFTVNSNIPTVFRYQILLILIHDWLVVSEKKELDVLLDELFYEENNAFYFGLSSHLISFHEWKVLFCILEFYIMLLFIIDF